MRANGIHHNNNDNTKTRRLFLDSSPSAAVKTTFFKDSTAKVLDGGLQLCHIQMERSTRSFCGTAHSPLPRERRKS